MVDAGDDMRYKLSSYEFNEVVNHGDVRYRNIPILIFLNKVDIKVLRLVTRRAPALLKSVLSS